MYKPIKCRNKKNLVLFIHGFTGAEETWTNDIGQSFADLLMESEEISENYDFAQIVYYSKLFDFPKINAIKKIITNIFRKFSEPAKRNVSIEKISNLVSSTIQYNCESYERIILVAHSMGGLIAKSVILNEVNTDLGNKIQLYISMAVPHSGSNFATVAKSLFRNEQIFDLNPLSESINELQVQWGENEDKLPLSLYLYGEYDTIVPKTSAIPISLRNAFVVSCEDDHTSITKPKTIASVSYLAIKKELIKLVSESPIEKKVEIQEFQDSQQYGDRLNPSIKNIRLTARRLLINIKSILKELELRKETRGVVIAPLNPISNFEEVYEVVSDSLNFEQNTNLITFYERVNLIDEHLNATRNYFEQNNFEYGMPIMHAGFRNLEKTGDRLIEEILEMNLHNLIEQLTILAGMND